MSIRYFSLAHIGKTTSIMMLMLLLVSNVFYAKCDMPTQIASTSLTPNCNPPTSLSAINNTNSTILHWTAANPVPASGYQYYYSIYPTAPSASTVPSGSTTATSVIVAGLYSATVYYYWVRSNCSGGQSNWVGGSSFTSPVVILPGCKEAAYGVYPSIYTIPACNGTNQLIANNAYASQYTIMNFTAGKRYTFSSSVSTDYITITNDAATTVYASGTTPVVWQSAMNSGTLRYFVHTNSACGIDSSINRSKFVACTTEFLANDDFDWSEFKFHPNPTSDVLNISYSGSIDKVEIFNMLGQAVIEQSIKAHEATVDMSQLTPGTYFVKAYSNDKSKVFKVVKK